MSVKKQKNSAAHNTFTVIGILLCIILIPMLIINITLIVKSYTNKDEVPGVNGYMPMIVLTDSMYPDIKSGDLIISKSADAESVKVNDVISFFDPDGNGTSVVTHRVIEITEQDGELAFKTKGDANNTEDKSLVPASKLIGVYHTRIPALGHVAMFMQTTPGFIVCVFVPLLLLIGYDILRRKMYEKSVKQDTDALLSELEQLKAEREAAAVKSNTDSEQ